MAKKNNTVLGWWISGPGDKLGYGDLRKARKGITHKIPKKKNIEVGKYGLHAGTNIFGALRFAPPNLVESKLWRVQLSGMNERVEYYNERYFNNFVGKERKYLYCVENYKTIIRDFLFQEVLDLNQKEQLGIKPIILEYLENPQSKLHSKFRGECRQVRLRLNAEGHNVDRYDLYMITDALMSIVPRLNSTAAEDFNFQYMNKLYQAIETKLLAVSDVNENMYSRDEIKQAFEALHKVPRTKLQKRIMNEIQADYNIVGCLIYEMKQTIRDEARQRVEQDLRSRLYKVLELAQKI